jgi:hypothetical protein
MRRPQRRLHLLLWIAIAPAIAAGVFLALRNSPAAPVSTLDEAIVTDGAR